MTARVDKDGVLIEKVRLSKDIVVAPPSAADDARAQAAGRKRGYHRIIWRDATGKRHTSTVGSTFAEAVRKAEAIDAVIESGADKADRRVSELIEAYLEPGLVKATSRKPRSEKTLDGYRRTLQRFVQPVIGHMRCGELNPVSVKAVLEQQVARQRSGFPTSLTPDESSRVRGSMRRLLRFGAGNGYVTQDVNILIQALDVARIVDPSSKRVSTEQGFHIDRIEPASVPSHEDVANLAWAMAADNRAPWWYELMVYTAAYSGLRIGELEGLEGRDITGSHETRDEKPRIRVERQVNVIAGRPKLMLPKGDKTRTTVYPVRTPPTERYPMGYPLRDKLRERQDELASQNNRMFPAPGEGHWWRSNFYRRKVKPAARRAGWIPEGSSEATWTWHSLRHVFCTYYMWDLGRSPRAVADAAGHSSVSVTLNLYGGAGVRERLDALD